jgi:signal transduction histidine kinase
LTRDSQRSPTPQLLAGLLVTLAALVACAWYMTRQIAGLRALQSELIDRSRRDSLQLLRIQNDLHSLAITMRDVLDLRQGQSLTSWSAEFQRLRLDLEDGFRLEAQLAPAQRTPEQREYLHASAAQFWAAIDQAFDLAADGKEGPAHEQIRQSLQRQAALNVGVARLLVENNDNEKQATIRIGEIYDRVQGQVYRFLAATVVAILLTSLYLMLANRRLFAQLARLSEQRRDLAQKLISAQESTLRSISLELHDEFGQILTAIGSMLRRARNHAPEGSPLVTELREAGEVAQSALQHVRGLSQALHPVMLDEAGLERTLDWYLPAVERQNGVAIHYEKTGAPFPVGGGTAVHVYRILQEALNNVARHSGAKQAWVRLRFQTGALELEVEDHGTGIEVQPGKRGLGLVALRERAQLLNGAVEFLRPNEGGTLVRLKVPVEN